MHNSNDKYSNTAKEKNNIITTAVVKMNPDILIFHAIYAVTLTLALTLSLYLTRTLTLYLTLTRRFNRYNN